MIDGKSSSPLSTSSFDDVLRTTRSIRRRLDLGREVDLDTIAECLELALHAPSGSNAQAWHFVVVTDPHRRAGLADCYRTGFERYRARPNSVFETGGQQVAASVEYLARHLHEVPVHLVACLDGRLTDDTPDSARAAFMASIIPATWSFMLACRSRGLGTCWTTMHLARERDAASILGLPYDDVSQVALIPVGHILGDRVTPAKRTPVHEVVSLGSYGTPFRVPP